MIKPAPVTSLWCPWDLLSYRLAWEIERERENGYSTQKYKKNPKLAFENYSLPVLGTILFKFQLLLILLHSLALAEHCFRKSILAKRKLCLGATHTEMEGRWRVSIHYILRQKRDEVSEKIILKSFIHEVRNGDMYRRSWHNDMYHDKG